MGGRRLRLRLLLGCICVLLLHACASYGTRTRSRLGSTPGCTLLLNVYSRPTTVLETLRHYNKASGFSAIVILWAAPTPPPSTLNETSHPSVHVVVPPDSSLNWRFYPWTAITTDCVMHMDDGKLRTPLRAEGVVDNSL